MRDVIRGERGSEVVEGTNLLSFYEIKILSWNVRGLNAKEKRMIVKSLLQEWKADVVCLQETKLKEVSKKSIKDLWGGRSVEWIHLDAIGAAGGFC